MNEIEHEGRTYILKSQVESIIKERVSKVAQKATEAEALFAESQKELEAMRGKQASVDVLTEQVNLLKSELASSKSRFERYQTMSSYGINDAELIEAIEWQYDKSMQNIPSKERQSLNDWFESHMKKPEEAPITIRPHLQTLQNSKASEAPESAETEEVAEFDGGFDTPEPIVQSPPRTNTNAIPAPEGKDLLRRTLGDQDFFNQNHEAIKQAWKARYGR